MPIDNLAKVHFNEQQIQDINGALNLIIQTLSDIGVNLDAAERRKYGKAREQNKLLINKVKQYQESQPGLCSPEVNWEEFEKDYQDRVQAGQMLAKIKSAETLLMNIKILSDYDNYTDALKDYQYAKYKNRFADEFGFALKVDELKGFFPNTGNKKKGKGDTK